MILRRRTISTCLAVWWLVVAASPATVAFATFDVGDRAHYVGTGSSIENDELKLTAVSESLVMGAPAWNILPLFAGESARRLLHSTCNPHRQHALNSILRL